MFRLGQRDEAEKDFRTAVALDPDDWTARNSLGACYLSLNRLDEAIAEFERMQALAPDNTRAYNNLGSAFLQQERFDKATEMYERSLSLDKNATAYSNLGTALYQQGRYADAARSFEGAVALPGATFLHWFNLGAACYWAPDLRGAREGGVRDGGQAGRAGASHRRRSIRSRLAELASGLRGAGAPDGRRRSAGASRARPTSCIAVDRAAAARRRRPRDARHDVRGAWRSIEGAGLARAGDQGGLFTQDGSNDPRG